MTTLAYALLCAGGAHEYALGFEEIYAAPVGGFERETVIVVGDEESFGGLWGQVMGFMMDKPSARPQVDFTESLVLAYFPGMRPTLGFRFELKGLFLTEGKKPMLRLRVKEMPPGEAAAQMISCPVLMFRLSKRDGPKGWWEKDFRFYIEKTD
ncbi:MAG: protease complex subunit PrcB family protein [candidate division WOR-3 bacterium]